MRTSKILSFLKALGPQLLTSREVAALLGWHQETLYRWLKAGHLSHIRIGGRLKFDPAQVIEYIERRSV